MREARQRFRDRVAIVTGAGQGIGEAYARALAREGAAVAVAEIDAAKGERVAADIVAAGAASPCWRWTGRITAASWRSTWTARW